MALFGAIFASRLDLWLPREVPAGGAHVDAESLQASPESLGALPATVRDGVADAVAHSLSTVFLVATPVALLGLLVVLMLRERPLGGPAPATR